MSPAAWPESVVLPPLPVASTSAALLRSTPRSANSSPRACFGIRLLLVRLAVRAWFSMRRLVSALDGEEPREKASCLAAHPHSSGQSAPGSVHHAVGHRADQRGAFLRRIGRHEKLSGLERTRTAPSLLGRNRHPPDVLLPAVAALVVELPRSELLHPDKSEGRPIFASGTLDDLTPLAQPSARHLPQLTCTEMVACVGRGYHHA